MKASVVHQYGGPEELRYEDFPDPVPAADEVIVKIAATSVNPIDLMMRSGQAKDMLPITFPGVIGRDANGSIVGLGSNVKGFAVGDLVFALSAQTYAELCPVKAVDLAKHPKGLDVTTAGALPLIVTTGAQLTEGTDIQSGQTVLVAGAAGSVGRTAVYAAKSRGARVIAGVLKSQLSLAKEIGADETIALDDESDLASLHDLDAVADAVGKKTAELLLTKVRKGGAFSSVLGKPANASERSDVRLNFVFAKSAPQTMLAMAEAVASGALNIPILKTLPLKNAAEAHAEMAKGAAGKILLIP